MSREEESDKEQRSKNDLHRGKEEGGGGDGKEEKNGRKAVPSGDIQAYKSTTVCGRSSTLYEKALLLFFFYDPVSQRLIVKITRDNRNEI